MRGCRQQGLFVHGGIDGFFIFFYRQVYIVSYPVHRRRPLREPAPLCSGRLQGGPAPRDAATFVAAISSFIFFYFYFKVLRLYLSTNGVI